MLTDPRQRAAELERRRFIPGGRGERFAGYGVMGLPFAGGDVLAFRRFAASSVGPPFVSVWHRDPGGRWTFYVSVEPWRSCPRYWGGALDRVVVTDIDLSWTEERELSLSIASERVHWAMRLATNPVTWSLSAASALVPGPLWSEPRVLALMGGMAGRSMRLGHVGLAGRAPNGQRFTLRPQRLYAIEGSVATVGGRELGPMGPLREQARLGSFRLPNGGIFAFGQGRFETFDPERHRDTLAVGEVVRG